jgi:hypothetical protein
MIDLAGVFFLLSFPGELLSDILGEISGLEADNFL